MTDQPLRTDAPEPPPTGFPPTGPPPADPSAPPVPAKGPAPPWESDTGEEDPGSADDLPP